MAHNLPVQLTGFVGREAELAALKDQLVGGRLVTICGPGGAGKTRLAAQVAAATAARWPEGVWWVELAAVTDPALVPEVAVSTVGALLDPARGPIASLTTHLRDHRALVCLDNCEQILDGAAAIADAIRLNCPEVVVLATSREPLGVPGEVVWRVPALSGDDALALFVERAGAVRPWFTVDASSEAAIRSLCNRLDGMPLALELAAAWLGTLTPHQLEAGLDDRFALLVRGPRGAVPRQQTLAASIDWSHDLLAEEDQVVLRRLAVFTGGFTLDAARAVCPEPAGVLASLARLVDKSLVVMESRAGDARYRLLETIRGYAAAKLQAAGEDETTRDLHLAYFLNVAESLEPELDRDKDKWRARIVPDRDNFRAALDRGLDKADPDQGRRLAAALAWLWNLQAQGPEGIDYLRRAIDRTPKDRSLLQAKLLTGLGLIADTAAPFDLDPAQLGLEIATELGDERLRARCLSLLAVGRFYVDFDASLELCQESIQAAEIAHDDFARDGSTVLRGLILVLRDQHDEARRLLSAATESLLKRGERGIAATGLGGLASIAACTGDLPTALRIAAQATATAEPLGDYHRVGTSRASLALLHGLTGDHEGGLRVIEPFVRAVEQTDAFVPGLGRMVGELHRLRGDLAAAIRWFERDQPMTGPTAGTYVAAMTLPAYGAALRQAGRTTEAVEVLERAVDLARRFGLPGVRADALAQLAHLDNDPGRHHEALAIRVDHGLRTACADSLDALATLAATTGRAADAVRVFAAVTEARTAMGHPRPPIDQPGYDATIANLREALGDDAFEAAWTEGAGQSLDQTVAFVRRTRGVRDRPSTGWASLTPTELDVVRLAVEGLNNPEIGARLFISRGTVKTHLAHVYAKLGVANRTELAKLAATKL
ncbi:helix-turn-helix transcriptional regulator [Kribbella deserti]|uniref:LuxR C-terminal-related transcriptional regulator n=1 Tax=Kribbella deserti TaxID=1926257 RepID=A0ABV6QVY3_9ACTN